MVLEVSVGKFIHCCYLRRDGPTLHIPCELYPYIPIRRANIVFVAYVGGNGILSNDSKDTIAYSPCNMSHIPTGCVPNSLYNIRS